MCFEPWPTATRHMPPQPTFSGKPWSMLTDNFRTPWIINGETVPF